MSAKRVVPFNDLRPTKEEKGELEFIFSAVVDSGRYILGRQVAAFEEEFAAYVGAKYCVGVGCGFDALQLILLANDLQDCAVAVPEIAPLPVWMAVSATGNHPFPYSYSPKNYGNSKVHFAFNLKSDVDKKFLSEMTAIIVVHMYGMVSDMEYLLDIAPAGLLIIEDCAQAHGARLVDMSVGSFGDVAAWSFYPTKNLGCLGDGGAITTSDYRLHRKLLDLREYGKGNYMGLNSRLDELQAAFLRYRLKNLDQTNEKRRKIAALYDERLIGCDEVTIPLGLSNAHDVYHQYVIFANRRDALREFLAEKGVWTMIHYPRPAHEMPVFQDYHYHQPHAHILSSSVVSLPIASVSEDDVEYVCEKINEFYEQWIVK